MRVADILTRDVVTVTPTTPLREVARVLTANEISGCPVVDVNGTLRGVISRTDLLENGLLGEEPANPELEEREAQDVMAQEPLVVSPSETLVATAALMHRERVHRLPVVEDGLVVGIVTSLDLLGAFGDDEGK